MEKIKIKFLVGILFCIGTVAQAQSTKKTTVKPAAAPTAQSATPTAAPAPSGRGQVLDFEGEVIEGERRRPDLFLQMSIENVKFESLMYNREDFNDYLEVDRKSRTRFLRYK